MDKCHYCDAEAEYKCLVEDDENPSKSHTVDACSEHIPPGVIETWTKAEWLAEE